MSPDDDKRATSLLGEALAIERAGAAIRESYVFKLSAVLPTTNVARYLHIENKIRTVSKYELSSDLSLVP